jgi:hypothetical protein
VESLDDGGVLGAGGRAVGCGGGADGFTRRRGDGEQDRLGVEIGQPFEVPCLDHRQFLGVEPAARADGTQQPPAGHALLGETGGDELILHGS